MSFRWTRTIIILYTNLLWRRDAITVFLVRAGGITALYIDNSVHREQILDENNLFNRLQVEQIREATAIGSVLLLKKAK
jgi:hypothetical protein